MKFIIYYREGCHLCDDLLWELEVLFKRHDKRLDYEWRDVDSQPAWQQQYGIEVPVLLDDKGQKLCFGHLDPEKLLPYLQTMK